MGEQKPVNGHTCIRTRREKEPMHIETSASHVPTCEATQMKTRKRKYKRKERRRKTLAIGPCVTTRVANAVFDIQYATPTPQLKKAATTATKHALDPPTRQIPCTYLNTVNTTDAIEAACDKALSHDATTWSVHRKVGVAWTTARSCELHNGRASHHPQVRQTQVVARSNEVLANNSHQHGRKSISIRWSYAVN
jgi:hypothetical protein